VRGCQGSFRGNFRLFLLSLIVAQVVEMSDWQWLLNMPFGSCELAFMMRYRQRTLLLIGDVPEKTYFLRCVQWSCDDMCT
jgi:hypothetical protein